MPMQLFEHNQIAYEAAVRMLSERSKAAVIHPTGTGKSFIGFKLCEDNPDKTICWLSPSRYIYQTQLENLSETSDSYQPENVKFYTYYSEHGDLKVPKDYNVGDFGLGKWIRNQKSQYRSNAMSDEHIKKLTAIGMVWENTTQKIVEESYETGFQHLEAFIAEKGLDALTFDTV